MFSNDKSALDAFSELKEQERPFQDKDVHVGEQLRDFAFCRVTTMQSSSCEVNILACPLLSAQEIPNIASSFKDKHLYVRSHDKKIVKDFITHLCPGNVDSILSEDILAIEGFMGAAYNAALLYDEFKSLRRTYTAQRV